MSTSVESARHEWEHGYRRLEATRGDAEAYARLLTQVEAIGDELRRRLGGRFTLAELVDTYTGAERWVRDVVSERAPVKDWPRTLATAEDAAFHLYQRGAVDYEP
jgi:hypothetical protein